MLRILRLGNGIADVALRARKFLTSGQETASPFSFQPETASRLWNAVISSRGFTLVELLVVIGIMGLLGTISVGGYRAMQRGMEERGVMQNVNSLVRAAFERAQIDRKPTAIYCWNETIRSETEDESVMVVGHAVAVRPHGRVTRMENGSDLVDEFGDLNKVFLSVTEQEDAEEGKEVQQTSDDNSMYLYQFEPSGLNKFEVRRSLVSSQVYLPDGPNETYLQVGKLPTDSMGKGKIPAWAFRMVKESVSGEPAPSWKTGTVYGLEFAEITLPHNYIFDQKYSSNVEDPIRYAKTVSYPVGMKKGRDSQLQVGTSERLTVYALRPDGSGGVKAERVGQNDDPSKND